MRRLVVGLLLALVLLGTAACGGGSTTPNQSPQQGTLSDVSVSGPVGQKPTVDFKAPMSFAQTDSSVVDKGPGTGSAVTATSTVTLDYVGINASDGTEFDSSWTTDTETKPATFTLAQVIAGFAKGLEGARPGDRVLITVASKDGYDPNGNGTSIRKGDSLVFVVDVVKVVNPMAQSQVPTLKLSAKKLPQAFVPKATSPATVGALGIYPLTKGKGPLVATGQTLTVNYLGQLYPDGDVFDESYSKKPVSVSLDQVIPGWQIGLVGQTVGSRVVLTVPSDLAYGAAGAGKTIPPNSDLIFVIDIQQAS